METGMLAQAVTSWLTRTVADRERERLSDELLDSSDGGGERPQSEIRFTKLMIEYYAQGLSQARVSFGLSMIASAAGGVILITGLALAIFRNDTVGDRYAAVVPTVAGVLVSAIGTLFNRQADKALKHMESQSMSLREDMAAEREMNKAIDLLGTVKDTSTAAHLQAALILKFAAADLPSAEALWRSEAQAECGEPGGAGQEPATP